MNKRLEIFKQTPVVVAILVTLVLAITALIYLSMREMVDLNSQVESYIGLNVSEAKSKAARDGLRYRVVSVDGNPVVITDDYRNNRVNVYVVDGRVVDARLDQRLHD